MRLWVVRYEIGRVWVRLGGFGGSALWLYEKVFESRLNLVWNRQSIRFI